MLKSRPLHRQSSQQLPLPDLVSKQVYRVAKAVAKQLEKLGFTYHRDGVTVLGRGAV